MSVDIFRYHYNPFWKNQYIHATDLAIGFFKKDIVDSWETPTNAFFSLDILDNFVRSGNGYPGIIRLKENTRSFFREDSLFEAFESLKVQAVGGDIGPFNGFGLFYLQKQDEMKKHYPTLAKHLSWDSKVNPYQYGNPNAPTYDFILYRTNMSSLYKPYYYGRYFKIDVGSGNIQNFFTSIGYTVPQDIWDIYYVQYGGSGGTGVWNGDIDVADYISPGYSMPENYTKGMFVYVPTDNLITNDPNVVYTINEWHSLYPYVELTLRCDMPVEFDENNLNYVYYESAYTYAPIYSYLGFGTFRNEITIKEGAEFVFTLPRRTYDLGDLTYGE